MTEWIGAAEAAERLGIKPASLYAYVSRGVLARRQEPGGRGSLYDAREIARLARKGRPRRAPAGAEIVIETAVTEITPEHLRYRGHDVMELAARRSFEEVALLLWGGDPDAEAGGWQATPASLAVGRAAQAALPPRVLPLERLQVIVPALAATDPLRLQLEQPAVIAAGRALIAGMVDCLPPAPGPPGEPAAAPEQHGRAVTAAGATATVRSRGTAGPDSGVAAGSIAGRLTRALSPASRRRAWPGWCRRRWCCWPTTSWPPPPWPPGSPPRSGPTRTRWSPPASAPSGARCTAGPRWPPRPCSAWPPSPPTRRAWSATCSAAVSGSRASATSRTRPAIRDPFCLCGLSQEYAPASPRLAVARAVVAEARRRALPEPNVDFALAALASVAGLVPGAGEAIFAVARAAGWIAHALEEYDRRAPIRPRGVYIAPGRARLRRESGPQRGH